MSKGKFAELFDEAVLNSAFCIYRMHRKEQFDFTVYKDRIIGLLKQYNEESFISQVEEWFNEPGFGEKKSNWKRLLRLIEKVKSETLKRELKKLYDDIVQTKTLSLLFYKIPVKFDSNEFDTKTFLRYFNSNSCIQNRRFEFENVFPVLVVSDRDNKVVGRALVYEQLNDNSIIRIIFNVYIQADISFIGFYDLLNKYTHDPDYIILTKGRFRGWVDDFYLDDYIVVSSSKIDFDIEEFLEDFYTELKDYVINDVIAECRICGEVIREDDDYYTTVEEDYYCYNCSDTLVYCDRCDGLHDPSIVTVVRIDLRHNSYYSCEYEIIDR